MDGRMEGRNDGWMEGKKEGWIHLPSLAFTHSFSLSFIPQTLIEIMLNIGGAHANSAETEMDIVVLSSETRAGRQRSPELLNGVGR